jgi:hypothetical protein
MKHIWTLILSVCIFAANGCDAIDPNNQSESENKIIMTIEPRLDVDENGYYHLMIDRNNWQTIHRVSGHLNYENGSSAELIKVYWSSNLYWYLGDTLGYIVHEGLTDDLIYVSYDTTYITGFSFVIITAEQFLDLGNILFHFSFGHFIDFFFFYRR